MKLITELTQDIQVLTEEKDGKKSYFIEGIWMQAGIKNRNGRVYPSEVLKREVDRYVNEHVRTNRGYGELGHPTGPTINLPLVSHMIKEIRMEGNDFYGKAKILDTPNGKIVKALIDEGAGIGVSSRGMGSLKENRMGIMEVQDDFRLATAGDIVADPSAPDAFVRGIMEGVEWIYDAARDSWTQKRIDQMATAIKKQSARQIEEKKFAFFTGYMRLLAEGKE